MATADRDVLDLSTTSSDLPLSLFSSGILDDSLREAFSTAIARGIPAICANMDNSAVLANGRSAYMPGLLKAAYEEMGGVVISFGKPQKAFFDVAVSLGTAAMNISSSPSTTRKLRPRVIHVGDSLHHDIAGAIFLPPVYYVSVLRIFFVLQGRLTPVSTLFWSLNMESIDTSFDLQMELKN